MVVAERRRGDVPLGLRLGLQIRRGEQRLTLRELDLGTPINAFAFQVSGEQHPRVGLIEVTDDREPLATPSHAPIRIPMAMQGPRWQAHVTMDKGCQRWLPLTRPDDHERRYLSG